LVDVTPIGLPVQRRWISRSDSLVEVAGGRIIEREHFDGEKRGAVALGAVNKQNEGPLRDSAGRPVMANAEQGQ
jgi:hypothetical protein